MDVAFMDGTAYALVTMVGGDLPFPGGNEDDVVGIYRMDSSNSFTVIADIGEFSVNNPPDTSFFIDSGVQYALEAYRGGFLVTDGHHNRVLLVTLDGEVSELITFDNTVPTGLETWGNTVYVSKAGPVPHNPETGKVVSFEWKSPVVTEVASGARLVVDVEFGPGHTLYALSQGIWDGAGEGSPALPGTGSIVKANEDGTFSLITGGLDRPTSFEFIGNTAYIVTLGGEIWKIGGFTGQP
jgi:hypothetical protein